MWIAFLIMLREGIEAALIVGIIAGFLKQAGQSRLLPYVWLGCALAMIMCGILGYVIYIKTGEIPQRQQELWVGILGFVAVGMLTYMVLWMKQAGHQLQNQLNLSVQKALQQNRFQGGALVVMAFLAVAREGLESVFFLMMVMEQAPTWHLPLGAILGLVSAAVIGYAIFALGVRINLRRFFQATGALIVLIAAGLLAGSLRALHEAGIWNQLQTPVYDWHQTLPVDGAIGVLLSGFFGYHDNPSLGEVLIWAIYLLVVLTLFFKPPPSTANPPSSVSHSS